MFLIEVNPILLTGIVLIVAIGGVLLGYFYRKRIAEGKICSAEEASKRIIGDAHKEAESIKKESLLEAKEEIHKLRSELEREIRERRNEIQQVSAKSAT